MMGVSLGAAWLVGKGSHPHIQHQPRGFEGWVLFLAVTVWLAPLRTGFNLLVLTAGVDPDFVARYYPAFVGEKLLLVVQLLWQILLLVAMTLRWSQFMPLFVGFGVYVVLMPLLDIVWCSLIFAGLSERSVGYYVATMTSSWSIFGWIVTSIAAVAWLSYVVRSQRVTGSFVVRERPTCLTIWLPPLLISYAYRPWLSPLARKSLTRHCRPLEHSSIVPR
jgi:hypothetical protein